MATTPSQILAEAMDRAEKAGKTIPCKEDPAAFTSDLLAFSGAGIHKARALAWRCRHECPVLAQCNSYAVDARKSKKTALYGVVAGRLEVAGRLIPLEPRELINA